MKRRERFMAATGWNFDPRVDRPGQCFPRLRIHLGPPRQEGALLDIPQRPRTVSFTARAPNRFAAEVGL
jgi:hypothetical protein